MFKILLTLLQVIRLMPMGEPTENKNDKEQEEVDNTKPITKSKVNYLDDLLLAVFLFPVIGAFLPWTKETVRAGLELIKDIPDWFSFIIVLIVISAFGLKRHIVEIVDKFVNRSR